MDGDARGEIRENQLLVDTVQLLRHPGSSTDVVGTVVLADVAAGEFSVVDGRLDIDVVVEATSEGVVAKGTAVGQWTGPCRRCLEPIVAPLEIELHDHFLRDPSDDETWPIEDERINLAPVLREGALLSLPLVPLCREECPGPEPDRFPTSVEVDVDLVADDPPPDPRWAALDDVHFDN